MTSAQLEYAQKRMQEKWYALAMAEQRGAAVPVLERLYNAYVLAMEEYNRYSDEYQREQQSGRSPLSAKQRKPLRAMHSYICS